MYPSFDPVCVFVLGIGTDYEVHDGAGAVRSAWDHGRDLSSVRKLLTDYGTAHRLKVKDDALVARVASADWLLPAILTIANVSAEVARAANENAGLTVESTLKDMIYPVLTRVVPPRSIAREFALRGESGKTHRFDYAIQVRRDISILMDAVSPHPVSIAAKYVAFADTKLNDAVIGRYVVNDRPLASDDSSLILQVAEILPFQTLEESVRRRLPSWIA
jgi:hypothetical protein